MTNPIIIPLTRSKTRNLIIDLDNVSYIVDEAGGTSELCFTANGKTMRCNSEFNAAELYKVIFSPDN